MGKYISRPNVVEAFHWTADQNQEQDPEWIIELLKNGRASMIKEHNQLKMNIITNEGVVTADRGDFIIKYADGSINRMRPGTFMASYKPLEEETSTKEQLELTKNLKEFEEKAGSIFDVFRSNKEEASEEKLEEGD